IVRAVLGDTVPELDEAMARVLDPPGALPPLFRDEARAIHEDDIGSHVLAGRAAALVVAGAPPERVAALRPARARVVNAAPAAVKPARDVPGQVARAHEAILRVAAREEGAVIAEALTAAGDAVCPAGTLSAGRIVIAADPWVEWDDTVPPPLEP